MSPEGSLISTSNV